MNYIRTIVYLFDEFIRTNEFPKDDASHWITRVLCWAVSSTFTGEYLLPLHWLDSVKRKDHQNILIFPNIFRW